MFKGKRLKEGDTIGLTAPAGPVDQERLEQAVASIERMGYRVQIGLTCFDRYGGYLAGPPNVRARELHWMFANQQIHAIVCVRGGYGSPQLLPLLNYQLIAENPKLFIGYSDITALHIAFQQRSNLATVHGPMAATDLTTVDDFTLTSLQQIITGTEQEEIRNPDGESIQSIVHGEAIGPLIGGNLSLISQLMGTPYEIDVKDKILFLEEVGEPTYKVDRMFTQLALAGKFSDAAGIVIGTWTGCETKEKEFSIQDLVERIIVPFGKPTIANVRAGHCQPMVTLPFGVNVHLRACKGELSIKEQTVIC